MIRTRSAIEAEAAQILEWTKMAEAHGANPSTFREYRRRLESLRAEWRNAQA